MKKHVIITSCNERYGDFLESQWLISLEEEINLKEIEVVIFDYGLSEKQLAKLRSHKVQIIFKPRANQVVNLRFIDIAHYLKKQRFDQVLVVDGGDIIFQSDISDLFNKDKNKFRAAALELEVLFNEVFIPGSFSKQQGREVYRVVRDKPVINAGFILGPREKIIKLGKEIEKLITDKGKYGPDQIVVNYVLHQDELILLDYKYNFMINNTKRNFAIKDGIFYENDSIIPVVHNAGHNGFLRPILNFGYGRGYNKLNYPMYYFKRWYYGNLKYLKKFASLWYQ